MTRSSNPLTFYGISTERESMNVMCKQKHLLGKSSAQECHISRVAFLPSRVYKKREKQWNILVVNGYFFGDYIM